jgi:hypothetical protein
MPRPDEQQKDFYLLLLELDHRVGQYVAHVNLPTPPQDLWVLFLHEPAHVGEEQPAMRVVWVSVCVTELVVHPVISHPVEDRVL